MEERPTQEDLEKVINLRPLIEERRKRKCHCKDRKLVIDPINREVTCAKCGQIIDAFDALEELYLYFQKIDNYLTHQVNLQEQLAKWMVSHKEPLALKPFLEHYRKGLLPYCPHCNKMIDLYDLNRWGNKKFAEKNKPTDK